MCPRRGSREVCCHGVVRSSIPLSSASGCRVAWQLLELGRAGLPSRTSSPLTPHISVLPTEIAVVLFPPNVSRVVTSSSSAPTFSSSCSLQWKLPLRRELCSKLALVLHGFVAPCPSRALFCSETCPSLLLEPCSTLLLQLLNLI